MRGTLAAQQACDIARRQSDMTADRQHDMGVILAYALVLGERLLRGGADRSGCRRIHEGLEHLIHHFAGLIDRRTAGRQCGDARLAHVDKRVDGGPWNGQCGVETIQRLVNLRLDMLVVHEGDARHRIVEHGMRFGNETGHHHGIEGIYSGVELHFGFDPDLHVHNLLTRSRSRNASQLEPMIGYGRAE